MLSVLAWGAGKPPRFRDPVPFDLPPCSSFDYAARIAQIAYLIGMHWEHLSVRCRNAEAV